jgi:CubicO group peptidase (beta-lactamase class C family)
MATNTSLVACLVGAAFLLVTAPVQPQTASTEEGGTFAAIDAHVRASMDASWLPGIAYAVTEDGKVTHVAAFGSAGPDGRPMTATTPVVIGSVGKSITALAIRQLVEAGSIDLDAPVTRYLPWFSLAGPDGGAELVTVRSLLDHTSGLSTADGQDPRWYEPGRTPEDVIRGLAQVSATVPVGTYAYSNLNYVVLGAIVEAVAGDDYGTYVNRHIFVPLGMTSSFTSLADAAASAPAQGYRYVYGVPVAFDEPNPDAMVAAGYQVSTVSDLASFVAALSNGGVRDGVDIVGATGRSGARRAYGTDWQPLGAGDAGAIIGQSGSTLTSNADILTMPSRGLGVVVLLNANPTQLLGMPSGAADIALDVLRLSSGAGVASTAPTVRTVYLAVDLVLLLLAGLLALHAARARTWRRRLAGARHPRFVVGRTILADLVLPVAVLVGVPLWIGSTGSSQAGNVIAGWRFLLWTLPDLALALLALAIGGLTLGTLKLVLVRSGRVRVVAADQQPGRRLRQAGP